MPDLTRSPWKDVIAFFHSDGAGLGTAVIVLVVALIALRAASIFVHGLVKALLDRETTEGTAQELSAVEVQKRMDTLEALGSSVLRLFIIVIAAITILGAFRVEIAPAIAGLGVIGLALGIGAQSLVKDYLNGALILVENQYSRGDVVKIADVSGTVEDFNLRRTTLRDLDGIVHTVPNSAIVVASNFTRTWARVNLDVTVAYGTDLERATEVVDQVGRELAEDPIWHRRVLEPPRVERVEALGEYGVTLKILGSVRAPDRWAASGELRKRLLGAFAANGIEIPRPQRVVLAHGSVPSVDEALGPGPTDDDLAPDGE
jgi:small-conductance mechanosensitive channel